jgi:hypothetical protein
VSEEVRQRVASADVLLVPTEGYADREDLRFFPAGTVEFFDFLRSRVLEGVTVEVCSDDDDYKEVTRHADVLYLPDMLVMGIFAPLLVGLVIEYVKMKMARHEESTTVKTSLTVHDASSGRSMRLDYDGPAAALKETVLAGIQHLQAGSQPVSTLPVSSDAALPVATQPLAYPGPTDEEHRASQSTSSEVSKQN